MESDIKPIHIKPIHIDGSIVTCYLYSISLELIYHLTPETMRGLQFNEGVNSSIFRGQY